MQGVPQNIMQALKRLTENGFCAYLVGGCVRDRIMGKTPHDFDIATSALPDEISACFPEYKKILSGKKHGTVAVIIEREPVEITTFRIDGDYADNRHPCSVEFTRDIIKDLSRRDFTVNAIAMDMTGKTVDCFGGLEDIKSRMIRCVGEPDMRFCEDGLRILRALRFSSVLDFDIDIATSESIHKNRELLNNISGERICSEFFKLICGKRAKAVLHEYRDVIAVFLGDTMNEKLLDRIDLLPQSAQMRLAALLYGCNTQTILKIAARLKMSNSMRDKVVFLCENADMLAGIDRVGLKFALSEFSPECMYELIDFSTAVLGTDKELRTLLDDILSSGETYKINQLVIDGNALYECGLRGKSIGEAQRLLLSEVIEGRLLNTRECLLKRARELV